MNRRRAGATTTAIVGGALLALTACVPAPEPPPTVGVEARAPEAPLTVIDETDASAAAIAASSALFASSPVVVVSPDAAEPTAVGADVAIELGVPLLVAPGDEAASADAFLAELDRLGATHVVSVQTDDASAATGDPGFGEREVVPVTGPDAASDAAAALDEADAELDLAHDPSPAVVLVTDDADDADGLSTAPTATARASGATILVLPAADPNPQRSAEAVEALHAADGAPAIAIGAGLAASAALDWQVRTARTGVQLPGGGQVLFPGHLLVAEYGKPDSPSLGVLGEQPMAKSIDRAAKLGATYDDLTDRTVMPTLEIITTLASGTPTPDGDYSSEPDAADLLPWIEAAGDAGQYVVLDLQPGRDTFVRQLDEYRSLLAYPWVGLALDPEWRLDANQHHLVDIGQVDASEVNRVIDELAAICDEHDLPPKLLVLHQFRADMILHRDRIDLGRPEVDVLFHIDGNGTQPDKQATWRALQDPSLDAAWGWKNFIDEDAPMLTPEQTMTGIDPVPDLVSYQ